MKASIHFELETPDDFAVFGRVFSMAGGFGADGVIVTPAPAAKPAEQIAKPVKAKATDKPAEAKPEAKPEVVEKPTEKPGEVVQEEGVEEVTKATVAKELRTFIQKKGEAGPKEALAVLKQFGASKFDELKAEHYSKFLTELGRA